MITSPVYPHEAKDVESLLRPRIWTHTHTTVSHLLAKTVITSPKSFKHDYDIKCQKKLAVCSPVVTVRLISLVLTIDQKHISGR